MKEKRVTDTQSALREKIALWEGRKGEPTKGKKPAVGRKVRGATPAAKNLFVNSCVINSKSASVNEKSDSCGTPQGGGLVTRCSYQGLECPSVTPTSWNNIPSPVDLTPSPKEARSPEIFYPPQGDSVSSEMDNESPGSSVEPKNAHLVVEVPCTIPWAEHEPPCAILGVEHEPPCPNLGVEYEPQCSNPWVEDEPPCANKLVQHEPTVDTHEVDHDEPTFDTPGVFRIPARNEAVSNYWKRQTLKLELELKDEKVLALSRELDDLNFTGKSEEEVALLKKAKHDLELRVKDQEEELDDLAGQVQMLESAKIRLEMSIEQMRKENRKEISLRDEEIEEVRVSAQKKIKALETQLESEHEERTQLVREKHDLERRLMEAHSRSFATVDEDAFHRVKKELKKTKALLKDTQTMLEKTQSEGSNKLLMRQLKTQLEDAEFAKTAAIKARQSTESDFAEIQNQLEEALRAKKDAEDRLARINKEKAEMQTQVEESEEEVAEVMKKYKATVSQLSVDQVNIAEQAQLISDLERDKQVLQEKLTELSSKVEVLEGETANIHTQRRLQMKIKELESKLDLESTTRQRLESQITRLKDQVDRMTVECDAIRMKEAQATDHGKKLNRQLREAKEDVSNLQQKLTDSVSRKQEVEKQYELAESEIMTLKSDLKLAFKRIEDLQQALQGDISDSDSEISDSDSESEASLAAYLSASTRSDRSPSNTALRTPPAETEQESKLDGIGHSTNELMSVIKEDSEEDYKESFA